MNAESGVRLKPDAPTTPNPQLREVRNTEHRTAPNLKHHPHAELRLPRRRNRIRDAAERRQRRLAIGLAGERAQLGDAEIGAVEDVEHLEAELQAADVAERGPARVLLNARSSVRRSGPMKSPRPVLPNVPAGCRTNAAGLNHWSGVPLTALSGPKPGA